MTKMHFKAFADYIRFESRDAAERERFMNLVAWVARGFNGRFDPERFRAACTPPDSK